MPAENSTAEEAYCDVCDGVTELVKTVPWQDDICAACSNPVDDGGSDAP